MESYGIQDQNNFNNRTDMLLNKFIENGCVFLLQFLTDVDMQIIL